ncbi:MAG TPA: PKD domain-containing protein [Flavobacteriales bacterium]|nr:PKD domain-containing protein [Flavobacteriales bacterium]
MISLNSICKDRLKDFTFGKKGFMVGVFMLLVSITSAQLVVDNSVPYDDVQYLIENVFFEAGVNISNISYFGVPEAIGFFDGTASNLGLDSGLVMCTGDISMLPGPNVNWGITLNAPGCPCPGDPDSLLDTLSGDPTSDAAILKFDFIPYGDSIIFEYVFGSEEYQEFVLLPFWNDVMAMFLSGPKPSGGNYNNENIALVPGTSLPVSVLTVNHLLNTQYYVENDTFFAPPPAGLTIELDAFTVPLTASASVICGATYTLKIGIADAGNDNLVESAVFLKARSFGAPGNSTLNLATTYFTGSSDSSLIEGCGYVDLTLTRAASLSDSMQIAVSYSGVAVNGVDYNLVPDTIVIPANSSSYTMQINPILDFVLEGNEDITIVFTAVLKDSLDSICNPNVVLSVDLIISDLQTMELNISPDIYLDCPGDTAMVYAFLTNALGGAVLTWNTGLIDTVNLDSSSFGVSPTTTTEYIVTATDSCGTQVIIDTVTVFSANSQALALNLSDTTMCQSEPVNIVPVISGGDGSYTYVWSTGDTTMSVVVVPGTDSVYSLVVTDGCGATITGQSQITISTALTAAFTYVTTSAGELILTNTSTGESTYLWELGDGTTSSQENLTHTYSQAGTYSVTLTVYNQDSCMDEVTYTVDIITKHQFYVPNILNLNSLNQDNNRLYVFGEGIETLSFTIYDRWGSIVYESSDASTRLRDDGLCCAYGEGWDGTYNNAGETLNTSVFAYIAVGTFTNGEEFKELGNITLIK